MGESNRPGWKADPWQRHEKRRWNGTAWTAEVFDGNALGEDPWLDTYPAAAELAAPTASVADLLSTPSIVLPWPDMPVGWTDLSLPVVAAADGRTVGDLRFAAQRQGPMGNRTSQVRTELTATDGTGVISVHHVHLVTHDRVKQVAMGGTREMATYTLHVPAGPITDESRWTPVGDGRIVRIRIGGAEVLTVDRHSKVGIVRAPDHRRLDEPAVGWVRGALVGRVHGMERGRTGGDDGVGLRYDHSPMADPVDARLALAVPLVLMARVP